MNLGRPLFVFHPRQTSVQLKNGVWSDPGGVTDRQDDVNGPTKC